MSSVLKVDIWSDIACPWCYVGKHRFAEGVRRHQAAGGGAVDVEYHSFELAPDTPVDFQGNEADFLADHKGLPLPQVRQMLAQMTEVARREGLDFDYDSLQHTNTLMAHEALHAAKAHGRQEQLMERLFRAYFSEGRHVGHEEELADLAADVGLDRESVLGSICAGTYRDAVAADIAQARTYGIRGVPFFVIDQRYGVSGAQDPEVFTQALREATAGT